jgi:hypothetical protein
LEEVFGQNVLTLVRTNYLFLILAEESGPPDITLLILGNSIHPGTSDYLPLFLAKVSESVPGRSSQP